MDNKTKAEKTKEEKMALAKEKLRIAQEEKERADKEALQKRKVGRPAKYSLELGKEICNTLATSFDGIRLICQKISHFPDVSTIKEWRHTYPEFSALYEAAKLKQALSFGEDIVDIADTLVDPYINTEKGLVPNPIAVPHARLRMDARKWIACKLLPKVYGDKIQQEVTIYKHEDALKELE